jgi:hypothetical protein
MENYFEQLATISVKDKIEKKGNFNYLSWANAWAMIKMKYPNAQRVVYESEHTGLNFFSDGTTAYVKVGVIVNDIEHIDYLPIMDYRNKSITLDKITSMDVNTAIQRSTAKAVAMHGLGLSLWVGEDIVQATTPQAVVKKPKTSTKFTLDIGDDNWDKVLTYVAKNKNLGLAAIVKNLSTKYKVTKKVENALKGKINE